MAASESRGALALGSGEASGLPEHQDKPGVATATERGLEVLPIDTIRTEVASRVRVKPSPSTADDYAEALADGQELPPVVVFRDAERVNWLADGAHRVEAARKAGRTTVVAEVRPGGERDAFLYAAQANLKHGLRAEQPDREQVARILLTDPHWKRFTDRAIERLSGLNAKKVAKFRKEESADGQQTRVAFKNGQEVEMNVAGLRNRPRKKAPGSPPAEQPDRPSTAECARQATEHVASGDGLTAATPTGTAETRSADADTSPIVPPRSTIPPASVGKVRDWAKAAINVRYIRDCGILLVINEEYLFPRGLGLFAEPDEAGEWRLVPKDFRYQPDCAKYPPEYRTQQLERYTQYMAVFGRQHVELYAAERGEDHAQPADVGSDASRVGSPVQSGQAEPDDAGRD